MADAGNRGDADALVEPLDESLCRFGVPRRFYRGISFTFDVQRGVGLADAVDLAGEDAARFVGGFEEGEFDGGGPAVDGERCV